MDESTCSAPQKTARKVGPDGMTKDQRYYRKNAQRIKRRIANRQKRITESIASRGTNDVGVQTDKPLFEMGETNIYEGLTGLGLHGRVFRWTYQNGGLNLWNDAINKQFQEAVTSGRVIQLRQLKEDLESTLTTGKKLLEMMNSKDLCEFSKGIQPGQARDFGNCIEMVSDVSKGIGSLEGWLTILTTKLEPFDYDTVLEYDSDSLEE